MIISGEMAWSSSDSSRETGMLAFPFLESFDYRLSKGFYYSSIAGLPKFVLVPKYISYDDIPSQGSASQSISGAEAVAA